MDEVKKLTAELKTALDEKISSKEFLDFMQKMAETKVEDTGEFEMIISTEHEDRSGEIVMQDGIDTSHYKRNPIVLWAHNYSTMPVAITDSLRIDTVNGVKCTIAKGRFAPTEFGQELRKMYDNKFMNTASIGFMALEMQENKITKSQLLEWSFVPVPCNSFAERMKEVGINIEMLKEKGFSFEVKEGEPVKTEEESVIEEPKKDDEVAPTGPAVGPGTQEIVEEKPEEKKDDVEIKPEEKPEEQKPEETKTKINSDTMAASLKLAISTIKTSLAALEAIEKSFGPEGSDETEKSLKQRSRTAKVDKEVLDSFLLTQSIMRSVNQATSEGLAHLKTKLREMY